MGLSYFSVVLCLLVICSSLCSATIDLSNLDLLNFKYFKEFSSKTSAYSQDHHPALSILQPITENVQKAKAVLEYFKNLLFGNPLHEQAKIIEFDPNFGDAWQPHFEHHYGPKGSHLVNALGKGYSPLELKHYGAVPQDLDY